MRLVCAGACEGEVQVTVTANPIGESDVWGVGRARRVAVVVCVVVFVHRLWFWLMVRLAMGFLRNGYCRCLAVRHGRGGIRGGGHDGRAGRRKGRRRKKG